MEDFLSIENFKLVFDILSKHTLKNFDKSLDLERCKQPMYKLMDEIFKMDIKKREANKILLRRMVKIVKVDIHKNFFNLENEPVVEPVNKKKKKKKYLSDIDEKFQRKFKKILSNDKYEVSKKIIIEVTDEPKALYKNVLKSNEFKEYDPNIPPRQLNEDLLIPLPEDYRHIYDDMYNKKILTRYIAIDSRDRNNDLYSENNYIISLDEEYYNVASVELLSAEIPNSEYVINVNNNQIHFQETAAQVTAGTFFTAEIDIGNYTESEIATELVSKMNSTPSSVSFYSVTVTDNKYTIESDLTSGLFNLLFDGGTEKFQETTRIVYKKNSIGELIGFDKADLSGNSEYTSQFITNLNYEKYLYLYITDFDNVDTLSGYGDSDKYVKISLNVPKSDVVFYSRGRRNDAGNYYKKIFDPPISFGKFRIQFKDYNNNFYNFNGLENSFILKLEQLNIKKNLELIL